MNLLKCKWLHLHLLSAQLLLFMLICGTNADAHSSDAAKHVLILHSYHQGLPWTDRIMEGMQEILNKSTPQVHVDVEHLDTKRHRDSEYFYHILDAILHYKFKDRSYDLVLLSENEALKFALEHRNDLFRGTPIVFCAINSNNPALLTRGPEVTGVQADPDFAGVITQALAFHPNAKKIVVIGSTEELSERMDLQRLQEIAATFAGRLKFVFLTDLPDVDLSKELGLLERDSVILMAGSIRDRSRSLLSFSEQTLLLKKATHLPIYSFWDVYIGEGIVGGPVVDAKQQGKAAAEMAIRILRGEPAASIPVATEKPGPPMFDYKELVRLGIPLNNLPAGSIIINQPSSFYQVSRSQFWTSVCVFLVSISVIVILVWNIVQRHKAQVELLLGEQKYRQLSQQFQIILDGIPDGLTLISPDMKVVWSNKGAGNYFNKTLGSIPGEYCCKLLYNRTSLCENCPAVSAFKSGKNEEASITTPDGRILEVKAFPLTGQDGEILHVIMLAGDITEKNRLREETIRSRRLASLGELAAGVAHEINNPNALILLNSELIKKACADIIPILEAHYEKAGNFTLGAFGFTEMREELPFIISETFESAGRIKRIVDDLKDFARADGPDLSERIDINHAVQASIRLVGNVIKNATDNLTVELADSLPPFIGNLQRVEQVIVNIIINACQALPSKSKGIFVSTSYNAERQACVVKVVDEGIGIPKENLAQIADPFFTTKRQNGGTGLGLSISMRIVKDYGGDLQFASALNEGTSVMLFLPVKQEIIST